MFLLTKTKNFVNEKEKFSLAIYNYSKNENSVTRVPKALDSTYPGLRQGPPSSSGLRQGVSESHKTCLYLYKKINDLAEFYRECR